MTPHPSATRRLAANRAGVTVRRAQRVDVARLARQFRPRTPVRAVAAVLTVLAVSLAAMWIVGSVRFAFTGRLPDDGHLLVSTTAFTHLGYVMDLPCWCPSTCWLGCCCGRHPWGYVRGTVMLVAGFFAQLTYMAGLAFQARAGAAGATAFDPFEPVIVSLYVIAAGLLLVNMSRADARIRITV